MKQTGGASGRAITGFLTAGVILLGLGFLADRHRNRPAVRSAVVPDLELVTPATGDTLNNPIVLRFRTPAPLRLDSATGWVANDLHLHAMVDGTEIMPAAADLVAGDSLFHWTLPPLEPGDRHIHLTWAGRHHGNLTGRTDTVAVHVQH